MYSRLVLFCFLSAMIVTTSKASDKKIVCYYGSWAVYRPGLGSCKIENINPKLCTHILYAFIGINNDGKVKILDPRNDVELQGFKRFTNLKKINPKVKTLVSIGGWNEGSEKFSAVAANPKFRKTLIDSAIDFMKKYGFDGFDIDWEYPAQRGGHPADKANFVTLLKEFRAAFSTRYLLSIASGATPDMITKSYDVPKLSQYLDFINVMTYDLHGAWDGVTGHNAPLYPNSAVAGPSVSQCIDAWIAHGANPSKIIMGIPAYGRTFILANPQNNKVGAPSAGAGQAGPYTQQAGMMGYNELCALKNNQGKVVWDNKQQVPYAYKGNNWVSFDNPQSVGKKMEYIKQKKLGGAMIWSIETDDFQGTCGAKYPILTTINNQLK